MPQRTRSDSTPSRKPPRPIPGRAAGGASRRRTPAVVLLSGGMDSAVVLAIAARSGFACHALSFDYGQRHRGELDAAARVARALGAAHHVVVPIGLRAFGGSALTGRIKVPKDRLAAPARGGPEPATRRRAGGGEIPVTYVPARNAIFLACAVALAEAIAARDVFIGVNAVDYSGYPDCRPGFIRAFERMANLATRAGVEDAAHRDGHFRVRAPLQHMGKAEIVRTGLELGVDFGLTLTCYDPRRGDRPCGHCDACILRARGFAEAGVPDPLVARRA